MAVEAVPVEVHNFPWTTALVGLLNLLVGGALVTWIRSRAPMRQIEVDHEKELRTDLIKRVETLERNLDRERELRQSDEAESNRRYEEQRRQHDRVIAIMRHRLNNSEQCIDALLMLLETSPEKVSEAVVRIKELRATQKLAEATEKAEYHADNIAAASFPEHIPPLRRKEDRE